MKYIWIGLLTFLLLACNSSQQEAQSERPNIILIIADDMAWDDCGAYGHPSIRTPHIDQLAKDGMRFDQAFLTTSSCSPSRTSIITGTFPHQTDAEQLHWPLPGDRLTFVEQLRAAGYWTAQAGKWHFGDAIKDRFDFIAAESTAGFVYNANGNNEAEYQAEQDGSGCQNWVPTLQKRPKDKPFFLWLAAVDPHRPYEQLNLENGHQPDEVRLPPYLPDNEQVREDFALYYDEIYRMDDYIGQVIGELDRSGLSENTLILFISDNGRAFPREKTTLYDGGIKTPWIVKWPGQVEVGSTSNALVSAIDIAPTVLALAGAEIPDTFEGTDFSEAWTDPNAKINEFIYAEDHWHDFEDYTRAIRDKRYKYIRNFYPDLPNTPPADALRSPTFTAMRSLRDSGALNEAQMACFVAPRPEEELYDTQTDPFELDNKVDDPEFKAILVRMRSQLEEIRDRTSDQLPDQRTLDEFTREDGQPLPNRKRPRPSKAEMFPAQ